MNMVRWPEPGEFYDDSGEGGLFAYMVALEPEDTTGEPCHVDVHAFLSVPDARVTHGPDAFQLWDEPSSTRESARLYAARHALERAGERELAGILAQLMGLARGMNGLMGRDEMSVPLRWAGFLGATSASLVDRRRGGYFEATPNDLTPSGRAVHNALAGEYGGGAVHILTFLDT